MSAAWWRWPALIVLTLALPISVTMIFRDATIAWPSSWALTARWPWWVHAATATYEVYLIHWTWRYRRGD